MTEKLLSRDPLTDLRRAFKLFDVDGTGVINLRDLRRVAKELGENLGEEELYVFFLFLHLIILSIPSLVRFHMNRFALTFIPSNLTLLGRAVM